MASAFSFPCLNARWVINNWSSYVTTYWRRLTPTKTVYDCIISAKTRSHVLNITVNVSPFRKAGGGLKQPHTPLSRRHPLFPLVERPEGMIFHVLNRGNAGDRVFDNVADCEAFEFSEVLAIDHVDRWFNPFQRGNAFPSHLCRGDFNGF